MEVPAQTGLPQLSWLGGERSNRSTPATSTSSVGGSGLERMQISYILSNAQQQHHLPEPRQGRSNLQPKLEHSTAPRTKQQRPLGQPPPSSKGKATPHALTCSMRQNALSTLTSAAAKDADSDPDQQQDHEQEPDLEGWLLSHHACTPCRRTRKRCYPHDSGRGCVRCHEIGQACGLRSDGLPRWSGRSRHALQGRVVPVRPLNGESARFCVRYVPVCQCPLRFVGER